MSTRFDRKQATAVNIAKIAKREFVSRFAIWPMALIHDETPLRVFPESMVANKVIFLCSSRMITAPGAFLVDNKTASR